jgi:phosphopantothenoylcysteine decarboxylase/phosphopantothenate--cysteine ligase
MTTADLAEFRVPPLSGKRILLGVTGSIAAYKAVELASLLTKANAQVDVLLSHTAGKFVSGLTFHSVTGRKAYAGEDLWGNEAHILHVDLARQADLMVVAPATAHTLAQLAHGEANGLVPLAALGITCPLIVAPAMDAGMYGHPAVQANVKTLRDRGVHLVGPAVGRLASGLSGPGRMLEPKELLGHARAVLGKDGPLSGYHVLVSAGGTVEPLDPVRSITNRSSGRQGYALAQAALDRGAIVTLVSGPTHLVTPVGAERIHVGSAQEMHDAVMSGLEAVDVVLMAAAVADFRPAESKLDKIKKEAGIPTLSLEATPDILSSIHAYREKTGRPLVVVGFAAESDALEENAGRKLVAKGLDLIVANDITAPDSGFDVKTNQVTILDASGSVQSLPLLTKVEVAERVLERVEDLLDDSRLSP